MSNVDRVLFAKRATSQEWPNKNLFDIDSVIVVTKSLNLEELQRIGVDPATVDSLSIEQLRAVASLDFTELYRVKGSAKTDKRPLCAKLNLPSLDEDDRWSIADLALVPYAFLAS